MKTKNGRKNQRTVTILQRYFIKRGHDAGTICCRVKNDQGDIYTVRLQANGTACW